MKRFVVTILMASVVVGACGKSEEEKRAEEAAKAIEQAAKGTEQAAQSAAQGLEAMARGLEQAASGSTASGERVDPVKFQDLIALLPQVDGWEREEPEG